MNDERTDRDERAQAALLAEAIHKICGVFGSMPADLVADVLVTTGVDAFLRMSGAEATAARLRFMADKLIEHHTETRH